MNAFAACGIILIALALSVGGGWFVTRGILMLAARNVEAGSAHVGPTSAKAIATLRGGTWIGFLERFAITGLILVGYPAGIAVLVAVKGLGRYPELRENPSASERFVIGTLASMVWAAGLGVLAARWIA
jgi:hypothetical protein